MQPTFMPWIGYFSMMKKVDKFVLLDDVQFDRRSWQQRNRILTKRRAHLVDSACYKKNLSTKKLMKLKFYMRKIS